MAALPDAVVHVRVPEDVQLVRRQRRSAHVGIVKERRLVFRVRIGIFDLHAQRAQVQEEVAQR
eukprot:3647285-Prorocentrum_lima.AAC.1